MSCAPELTAALQCNAPVLFSPCVVTRAMLKQFRHVVFLLLVVVFEQQAARHLSLQPQRAEQREAQGRQLARTPHNERTTQRPGADMSTAGTHEQRRAGAARLGCVSAVCRLSCPCSSLPSLSRWLCLTSDGTWSRMRSKQRRCVPALMAPRGRGDTRGAAPSQRVC